MKDSSSSPAVHAIPHRNERTESLASSLRAALPRALSYGVSQVFLEPISGIDGSLIVSEVVKGCEKSIDDVCGSLGPELYRREQSCWYETFQSDGRNFLAVLIKTPTPKEADSSVAPSDEEKVPFFPMRSHPTGLFWKNMERERRRLWMVASALSLVLVAITGFIYVRGPTLPHPYYDTSSSEGPRYSYLLTPDNITGWAEQHYDPSKYFVRLDEQALVPIELLDEQEMRYQQYLSTRYPEKAEMRDSRAWLDPDFFHDPNNFMLPTDMEFHRGHCIRVFRRYWQAKETGRHVCPWDIDYRHLHHCFSMMEDLMLPPGPRSVQEGMTWSVSWRTKVCAWEP